MKKYGKSEKIGVWEVFKGKMGFSGVWGIKNRVLKGFKV